MSKLGFIIDHGSSPIDGNPYVAILTLNSNNRKTGRMAQVWILREDINPVEALKTGEDYTICGDCPHRNLSCYVNVGQAPNSVWKAYKRGMYTDATLNNGKALKSIQGRKIRWGAYGDPSIIDPSIVSLFNSHAKGHTGYTHQWRQDWAQEYKGIFQASCDSFADYLDASAHGWKTFAVVAKNAEAYSGKLCPATVENSQAQCITCSLCDGAKQDIFVEAHGKGAKYVVA
jgi:hypothetical protein